MANIAGKISIFSEAHEVFLDGQKIALTHKEYELLKFYDECKAGFFT